MGQKFASVENLSQNIKKGKLFLLGYKDRTHTVSIATVDGKEVIYRVG